MKKYQRKISGLQEVIVAVDSQEEEVVPVAVPAEEAEEAGRDVAKKLVKGHIMSNI